MNKTKLKGAKLSSRVKGLACEKTVKDFAGEQIRARTYMNLLTHLLGLSLALGLVIGARIAWPGHYKRDRAQVAARAALTRAREIASGWSTLPFTRVDTPSALQSFLAGTKSASLTMSELQRSKATERVVQVVQYLEHPSLMSYCRLKTEGLRWRLDAAPRTTNSLASASPGKAAEPALESGSSLERIWNSFHQRGGKVDPPHITTIALDTVKAAISHTNSGRALLASRVKQGFTIAVEALEPGFHYYYLNNTNTTPLLFEFSFMARSSSSDNPGPIHVSFICSEGDQNWVPNRLLVDKWLDFPVLF